MKKLILSILGALSLISCATRTVPTCDDNTIPAQSVVRHESCVVLEDNSDFSVQLWGQKNRFWPKQTNITVRFLNGTAKQRDESWKRIQLVDDLIGLSFTRVENSPSNIRIMFDPSKGHWSYMGTDILNIPQSQRTMNIGLEPDSHATEYDRVVVHELLHSLGFEHEQQHPTASIPWDEEKVIDYYARTQGWSEAQTRSQVLNNSKMTSNFLGSDYDPKSIMHYPVDPSLTRNGYYVGWNTKLSKCDIFILQQVYGK